MYEVIDGLIESIDEELEILQDEFPSQYADRIKALRTLIRCSFKQDAYDALNKEFRELDEAEDDSDTISDGFGSTWSSKCAMCGKNSVQIVRPGKVQCTNCG
jgi:hypothetical protein